MICGFAVHQVYVFQRALASLAKLLNHTIKRIAKQIGYCYFGLIVYFRKTSISKAGAETLMFRFFSKEFVSADK
jgi:hypothetical protein